MRWRGWSLRSTTRSTPLRLRPVPAPRSFCRRRAKRDPRFEFDKALEAETTSSAVFKKQGDPAIVYYFGMDENRKAIAVKDLGSMPLKSVSGQITH
jgi:hypothetical protein